MILKRPALQTLALALATLTASFLVLDRWVVTKLGPLSFGRVWHLYINYFDFGFVRRGLVGTLFKMSHLSSLFDNEYFFAIFVQHVFVAVLVALIAVVFLRSKTQIDPLFKAVVFLSPTFILQIAYTTGSLDIFIVIVALLNIFYVRNIVLFSALLMTGVMVHELFLFTIPAQLTAWYIRRDLDVVRDFRSVLKTFALPLAAVVGAMVVIALFGKTDMPQTQFEATMAGIIPHAAHKMALWSGYFEVGSSIDDNSRPIGFILWKLLTNLVYIAIPVAYLLAVTFVLSRLESNIVRRTLLVLSALIPPLTYLVATDFFRWIGLGANMALFLLLFYVVTRGATVKRGWLVFLLSFSILAPFGGAVIGNPFPAHKFILNKLMSKPVTDD